MKFTFKPFKGGDKEASKSPEQSLPPAQRRREQVRRAQKTHRERKEAYTKSLEAEVVQLRANEARILQESKALQAEVGLLKKVLLDNGIPLPLPLALHGPDATLATSGGGDGSGSLVVPAPLTGTSTSSSDALESVFSLSISDAPKAKNRQHRIYSRRDFSGIDMSSPSEGTVSTYSPRRLGEADHTAIGIDFVLALEAPCLEHHALPADHSHSAPEGHSLSATAAVLHQRHAEPSARLQPNTPWQVSSEGIERLLELSGNFPLDGELTPVQAWNQIRTHQQYDGLEIERMEGLKRTLLPLVKCYGFGAVIEQGAFEDALFDAFVVGRVF